jgi:hypothetical protein
MSSVPSTASDWSWAVSSASTCPLRVLTPIRYADDTIVGFQHKQEARAFLDDLKERMCKFELALHPDKTRLIRFGRHAARQRFYAAHLTRT